MLKVDIAILPHPPRLTGRKTEICTARYGWLVDEFVVMAVDTYL